MVYLIIGPSCAGKTTFTKNTFIKDKELTEYRDLVQVTECDDCILLGSYLLDRRTLGTDVVARQNIKLIPEQVKRLLPKGKDIVLDGNKIGSRPMFDKLLEIVPKGEIKLYWIMTTPEISYERNMRNNSTCTWSHLKSAYTRSANLYFQYKDKMNGQQIDTSTVTDFSNFSLYNLPDDNKSDSGLW